MLVVTNPGDPFGTYYAEILRAEGLNEFAVTDTGSLDAGTLAGYQVVLLAQTAVTDAQPGPCSATGCKAAATSSPCAPTRGSPDCSAWAPRRGTVGNGYIKVNTSVVGRRRDHRRDTMQFHGTADR